MQCWWQYTLQAQLYSIHFLCVGAPAPQTDERIFVGDLVEVKPITDLLSILRGGSPKVSQSLFCVLMETKINIIIPVLKPKKKIGKVRTVTGSGEVVVDLLTTWSHYHKSHVTKASCILASI